MNIHLLVECEASKIGMLGEIAASVGMVLHRGTLPLELETGIMYVGTIDKKSPRDVALLWAKARQTIAEINGAALFQDNRWKSIELINIKYENQSGQLEWMPITGSMMATIPAVGRRNPTASELLRSAQVDEPLAKVLRLTTKKMDWANLYRILEVIREDCGTKKMVSDRWTTGDKIKSFTGSANNSSVSGDDSRHGKLGSGVIKDVMTHQEALLLVKSIITAWYRSKVFGD